MRQKRDGKSSRWDKPFPNQRDEWHRPWQPNMMPQPQGPWEFRGQYSENEQFQSAYQSDRCGDFDPYWNSNNYMAPDRNDFVNNSENNWASDKNNSQNPRANRPYGPGSRFVPSFPQRNASCNSAPGGSRKMSRNEENYLTDQGPGNSHRKESFRGFGNERQLELGQALNRKENNDSSLNPSEKRHNAASSKPNGKSLNERNHCSPQERRGNYGRNGRGLVGSAPSGVQYSWNRKTTLRHEGDEEEEKNEIEHWLQISKGQESQNERDKSPVSKVLPGSKEETANIIKVTTDRLKQALKQTSKQKTNCNLNELLSSGDEAKGDSQHNSKQKSFPQNLAQLELDASDMREIGRANTEKSNCVVEDLSDDDIMEVARPPTPVRPIIDLDFTPTKDHFDNSERDGCTLENGNVAAQVKNCVQSGSGVGIFQSTQGLSENNRDLTKNFVTNLSFTGLESSECLPSSNSPSNNSCAPETAHLNECRSVTEACPDLAELSSKPVAKANHLSQSDFRNVANLNVSCTRQSLIESETNNRSSLTVSPCVLGTLSTETNTTSPVEKGSFNLTVSSPSSGNQRRRRNSSACESPNYRSPCLGNSRPQQARSSQFEPRSPPFLQQGYHDSRQKKIISDLQRMSQSKLKDLINNPRSGKLDFAVKQLMKEHQAAISRKSRDVAEKRIPVEFLNPKSSDLPPDDSALLADFAIDWSSLPGELISTLGDLFQDFSSESTMLHVDSQLQDSGQEPSLIDSPACDQELPLSCSQNSQEKERNNSTTPKEESPPPVKIRVCQFARENLFSSGVCAEMSLDPSESTDSVYPNCQEEPSFTECISGKNSLNASVSNITPELFENVCVQKLSLDSVASQDSSQLQDSHQHAQIEENSTNQSMVNNNHAQKDVNIESNCLGSPIQLSDSSVIHNEINNAPANIIHNASVMESNSTKAPKNKKSKNNSPPNYRKPYNSESPKSRMKNKHKQKRFVHLEERSWFEDSHSRRNVKSPIVPSHNSSGETTGNKNTTEHEISAENENTTEHEITTENENTTGHENTTGNNADLGNRGDDDNTLIVNNSTNILPVDKQCVSMLPVLMMTVPADGLPDIVCNMSVAEMQKRLEEIDSQLQSLVQERFILSQALKASQSSVTNSETIASAGNNQPIIPTEDVHTVPSSSTSITIEGSADQEMPLNDNQGKKTRDLKRKSSSSDEKLSKKKKKADEAVKNGTLTNFEARTTDCCVLLERMTNKSNKNKSEVIVLDGDDEEEKEQEGKKKKKKNCKEAGKPKGGAKKVHCENPESANISPVKLLFHPCPKIEGNILDTRVFNKNIYAASQNGLLYCMSTNNEIIAIFGEKTQNGCTGVEVVMHPIDHIPYVYTGGGDGVLRVYKSHSYASRKNIQPDITFPISSAIHCMECNWDMLYIGTRAGSIVPFNIKTGSVGEPISLGGYPVLAIKSCLEGPRKVLIVSCRQQPLAVRDAVSGLLLRTIGQSDWNVYSIALYKNWVLCGSNSDKVSVFDFQSGEFIWNLDSGMGVIDMKILCQNFLIGGCYDGRIFFYDLRDRKKLFTFEGPGKMVLSLQYIKKKLFCSSKDSSLSSCKFPKPVLKLLQTHHNVK